MVSALFLPFTDDIIEAAVAEDTMKAPEAPEEVSQMAAQLEVAMAVQDQLTSKVQQLASDLQQKVGTVRLLGPARRRALAFTAAAAGAA